MHLQIQLQTNFQNKLWWNDKLAIILDDYIDIKTSYFDFKQALKMQGATRFCFDFGIMNKDSTKTYFPFALVPLNKEFTCERTLVYGNGKKVQINSTFGMFDDDFINIKVPHIEINESNFKDHGIIVSNWNNYFDIINALAKHFRFVSDDNDKSFILSNSELMNFALVPFTLKVDGNDIVLENVEKEMATSEFDAFIDSFVVNDSLL